MRPPENSSGNPDTRGRAADGGLHRFNEAAGKLQRKRPPTRCVRPSPVCFNEAAGKLQRKHRRRVRVYRCAQQRFNEAAGKLQRKPVLPLGASDAPRNASMRPPENSSGNSMASCRNGSNAITLQ